MTNLVKALRPARPDSRASMVRRFVFMRAKAPSPERGGAFFVSVRRMQAMPNLIYGAARCLETSGGILFAMAPIAGSSVSSCS